jgi:acyl-CoA reductase-like NAD-dependent aldehyde dehydrogenase
MEYKNYINNKWVDANDGQTFDVENPYTEETIAQVTSEMEMMNVETFGPIIPIQKVKNLDEAIELANTSQYGLGCNIYTNDMEKALTAADDIKAGSFWINDPLTDNEAAPFGGMKMSGGGRELGIEGLDEFSGVETYFDGLPDQGKRLLVYL